MAKKFQISNINKIKLTSFDVENDIFVGTKKKYKEYYLDIYDKTRFIATFTISNEHPL